MELDYSWAIENILKTIDDHLLLTGKRQPSVFDDWEAFNKEEMEATATQQLLNIYDEYFEEIVLDIINNLLKAHKILNYEDENCDFEEIQDYYQIIMKEGLRGYHKFLEKINMTNEQFCKIVLPD